MDMSQSSGGRRLDGPRRRLPQAHDDVSSALRPETYDSGNASGGAAREGVTSGAANMPTMPPAQRQPGFAMSTRNVTDGAPLASSVGATPQTPPPAVPPTGPPRQVGGSGQPPRPRRRRPWRWVLLGVAVVIIAVAAWFGFKTWSALSNVIQKRSGGSAIDSALATNLKGEGAGRVNILLMGIGGAGHDGPDLSDTMIVWSIDPKTYDVAAISVPRDLYVKIPNYGYSKINAANANGGADVAEKVIENVLGIDVHYFVTVDFSGFKQAIDAVGGVDVDVPTALYDKQYPCETGNKVCPYSQAAGRVHMNGTQALKYARCRHNDPGVGNCGNDYGRSARQQQIVAALRTRALSLGTLTNPAKITGLIDTVGDHVKTDLQLSDMRKLAQIATKIDTSKVVNKVLDDSADNYLVGGTNIIPAAGYIYVPKAGNFDYSDIHDFVKNIFVDRYITSENARIEIANGSGITGLASKVATSLERAHYNVLTPTNADSTYPKTVIYDYTGGKKPYTIKYLEQRFGVTAQKAAASPSPSPSSAQATTGPAETPEIRIILGSNYQSAD